MSEHVTLESLLAAVRAYYSCHLPEHRPRQLHVTTDDPSGELRHPIPPEQRPAPEPTAPPPPTRRPPNNHSEDYRTCTWHGADFAFTPTQAKVIGVLWEAAENGVPDVSQETLLEAAGSEGNRLRDVFRNNPAWGTLIVAGATRGSFRLG